MLQYDTKNKYILENLKIETANKNILMAGKIFSTLDKTKTVFKKQIISEKIFLINKNKEKKTGENFEKETMRNLENMKNQLKGIKEFEENFELEKLLGQGGSGTCFLSKVKKYKYKKVCLKFIALKYNEEKRNKKIRENKEIKNQIILKNKNIANLFTYYQFNNYLCIAIEYAKYGDLSYFQRNLLKKKYLSETMLNYIAIEVLKGLNYCHENKILHQDIKQQNILVDYNLNIKITDFSISQDYSTFSDNDKIILPKSGTCFFMSPEILNNIEMYVKDINKVDVYSFGVILYYLAYGYFPYKVEKCDKKEFKMIYDEIMNNNLEIENLKCYSKGFTNFLTKVLDKNIYSRYSIQDALNDNWIKSSKFIYKMKYKLNSLEKFLVALITNNIPDFNDEIKRISKFLEN